MNQIDLPFIAQQAIDKEEENIAFRVYLKNKNANDVDIAIAPIATKYLADIDCMQCGNCCKNIMISVNQKEINTLAEALQITAQACEAAYCDGSTESDHKILNKIPCHFLDNKKCTVYESRPSACASFPHLHLPNFTSRLFSMIDGYGICPQIYHSMEALKLHYHFIK